MNNFDFIPGLELNRGFFFDVVKPLLNSGFTGLKYSGALIGYGSDVLGYDNSTSMDHNWGPRCQIFIDKQNEDLKKMIYDHLSVNLPDAYLGYPVNFSDKREDGTSSMEYKKTPPFNHQIEIHNLPDYVFKHLKTGKICRFSTTEWLGFYDQRLLELTGGKVFCDGLGVLHILRNELSFFPDDILKLRLASLWKCVSNEEPFVGRCIECGDFIGLKLIASRITNFLLKICFYIERKYIPYSKWFGTSLNKLDCAEKIAPIAKYILSENDPDTIQNCLCSLFEHVISLHNKCGFLPLLENKVTTFYGRPYKVILAESIAEKLIDSIIEKELKNKNLDMIDINLKSDAVDFMNE